jgi:hypothetical protein
MRWLWVLALLLLACPGNLDFAGSVALDGGACAGDADCPAAATCQLATGQCVPR